ncbi:hypothetical protein C0J45_5064 [Silurus meridionalis]|nr:hypothetical protein C0J45_5064 [Silurus meridionalis]
MATLLACARVCARAGARARACETVPLRLRSYCCGSRQKRARYVLHGSLSRACVRDAGVKDEEEAEEEEEKEEEEEERPVSSAEPPSDLMKSRPFPTRC